MTVTPLLTSTTTGDQLMLAAAGSWTATHAAELDTLVAEAARKASDVRSMTIDMAGVGAFDTFGAWLLERLRRDARAAGRELTITGLPDHDRSLFAEMQSVPATQPQTPTRAGLLGALETLGRSTTDMGRDFLAFANIFGAFILALGRVIQRPSHFRLTPAIHQLDRVGWQGLPIILLITFLIGAVIAQQGIFHFRQFGADMYVVDMVGILLLREVGVLLVAIMVAGRSGSAYTAELGSMKMREEIDALKTMGVSPVEILVVPRVLVLFIALPMLTFAGSIAALYGGGLVAWLYGGMSPEIFVERLRGAISITHFEVGMIKAPFMGLVIGIIACTEGLRVKGSAESLGIQTTRSVVKAIFAVIVLDGLFAIFFASIGM